VAEIAVHGLAELDALLKTLPAKVEANVLRGAVRAGQKVVAERAQALVPEDTGALKRSVRVKTDFRAARRGFVRADVVAGGKSAWYANLIEFGTGQHYSGQGGKSKRAPYQIKPTRRDGALYFGGTIRKAVTHPGIRPQPFMRPAAELLDGPALDAFVAYVQKRLPKELAKQ
jgi:HK97 gp10 family phage protein